MGASESCSQVRKSCSSCTLEAGTRPATLAPQDGNGSGRWSQGEPGVGKRQSGQDSGRGDGNGRSGPRSASHPSNGYDPQAGVVPAGTAGELTLHEELEEAFSLPEQDCSWKADEVVAEVGNVPRAVDGGRGPSKDSSRSGGDRNAPDGFVEANMEPGPEPGLDTVERREDSEPPEELPPIDFAWEAKKAAVATLVVVFLWFAIFYPISKFQENWEPPYDECPVVVTPPKSCKPCASDLIFLPLFSEYERHWNRWIRAALYFTGLLWTFLGIGMICDQFMSAIEEITAKEKVMWLEVRKGSKHKFHVKFWNPTVANLSLMALGSSAPEILLAVIEIFSLRFFAGELGPSTIVGSAAFNLLIITAVCVSAIAPGEVRYVAQTDVFAVTASFSIFAYFWMLVVLKFHTEDKVDLIEAAITFCFFPVLLGIAFAADKGLFSKFKFWKSSRNSKMDIEAEICKLQAKYGKDLPRDAAQALILQSQPKVEVSSRSKLRQEVMSGITGGKIKGVNAEVANAELLFGFEVAEHACLECAGKLQLKVIASRAPNTIVQMKYRTLEGTARAGQRFEPREGHLRFIPGQTEAFVEVPIIDDDTFQEDESFHVELSDIIVGTSPGRGPRNEKEPILGRHITKVTVLNDDMPGTLSFDADEVYATEGMPATLGVQRTSGSCGRITCDWATLNGSALEGRDFSHTEGTLVLEEGQEHCTIQVPILQSKHHISEGDERFSVLLRNPSRGVKFEVSKGGGSELTQCDIVIPGARKPSCLKKIRTWFCNEDKVKRNYEEWKGQFVGALFCNGTARDQVDAGMQDWILHCLSLTFKVPFALVPPPCILGGWACFCGALAAIGLVTALVGDLATLLGCCLEIPSDVTAITLVALGTSLPDTFASKLAAQQDATADNSVGNVTGSNSVNVFLGLGLPWTLAAVYWEMHGDTPEWHATTHKGVKYTDSFAKRYSHGFIVPAGSLALSVGWFTFCALICLTLLVVRRRQYGGELGGPKNAQHRDSGFLVLLWFSYISFSTFVSLSQKDDR